MSRSLGRSWRGRGGGSGGLHLTVGERRCLLAPRQQEVGFCKKVMLFASPQRSEKARPSRLRGEASRRLRYFSEGLF